MAQERESFFARNRSHDEINKRGAVANLNDGLEISTHGVNTRLLAWPGTGFKMESIHMLTFHAGDESEMYDYAVSEEAMLCLKGNGQVFIHDQWTDIEAGDIAYFPEGVTHAVRNTYDGQKQRQDDFVIISSISQPPIQLYEASGYYDKEHCVMKFEKIDEERRKIKVSQERMLSLNNELHLNESFPKLRAWNLSIEEIRSKGALFNVFKGADFGGIDVPMKLILWPGYGVRTAGFHIGYLDPQQKTAIHTHPISDEFVIQFTGMTHSYVGDDWVDVNAYDCVMAPCGVLHGGDNPSNSRGIVGGFASPPQIDLYLKAGYYNSGGDAKFAQPPYTTIDL